MCGIVGYINIGDKNLLEKSVKSIKHRGPDDDGIEWFDEWNSGFGHTRLSIIDLSLAGHQPMFNDDKSLCIVFNGEIYNFKDIEYELKKVNPKLKLTSNSDTEILLKSYEYWGSKCLDKLNGMFSFAIINLKTGELFAARDRLGIKPFYYTTMNGGFIFSSEIKAILISNLIKAEPDIDSITTQMHYQVAPKTGFKNIYKLAPGHCLEYSLKCDENDKLSIKKWWEINVNENYNKPEDELVNELDELLNDSVRLQMISDVPIGILLSGGLDSSLIAALMRRHNKGEINAFTIKFSAEDQKFEKMEDDSIWAKKVADLLELNYKEILIKPDDEKIFHDTVYHLDEPIADPAAINTYLISKAARKENIVVLLSGMGGDEIFGGYRKHLACLKAEIYQKLLPKIFRHIIENVFRNISVSSGKEGYKILRWIKRFLSFASFEKFERFMSSDIGISKELFDGLFVNSKGYENTYYYKFLKDCYEHLGSINDIKSAKDINYLTRMCYCDTKSFLPAHNLTYSDKSSMMAGVEIRPPLIDHRIAEFMFSLPPKYRIKGNTQKYLLKKVAERYLPKDVVHRPKAPFASPLRAWIKGQLMNEINLRLSKDRIESRNVLNPDKVWDLVMADRNGKSDYAHLVWRFLTLDIWFDTFFNKTNKI
ncbi:MAG: asparagine synthase (glutamine-hydrolyzing) [Candidatus Kapaibacterium sp.]